MSRVNDQSCFVAMPGLYCRWEVTSEPDTMASVERFLIQQAEYPRPERRGLTVRLIKWEPEENVGK